MSTAIYREDGLASSTAMKGPCRVATTANITLSGEQTIDGVACVTDDRVLVRSQTTATENGIYVVDTGAWRRAYDFAGNRDVRKGTRISINEGTTYALTEFYVTTSDPITIDTSSISFSLSAASAAQSDAAADAAAAAASATAAGTAETNAETAQAAAEAALASVTALLAGRVGVVETFAVKTAPSGWLACDGAAVSRTTYADLYAALVTDSGFSATSFTVSIASPAVFTKASHGFSGGERIRLATTSALPGELSTSVDYYVVYASANTFQVSLTFGGSSINTTGTQSGAHTYTQSLWGLGDGSTTFNVPTVNDDDRLPAPAGTGRQVGTPRAESIGPHNHSATFTGTALAGHDHTISGRIDESGGDSNIADFGTGTSAGDGLIPTSSVSAGTPAGSVAVANNSGTVNLPPTVALLYCVYTGVA